MAVRILPISILCGKLKSFTSDDKYTKLFILSVQCKLNFNNLSPG